MSMNQPLSPSYANATDDDWLTAWHRGFADAGVQLVSFSWWSERAPFITPPSFVYALPEAPQRLWYVAGFGDLIQHDCVVCNAQPTIEGIPWPGSMNTAVTFGMCEHGRAHTYFAHNIIGEGVDMINPQGPVVQDLIDAWILALTTAAYATPP